MQLGERGERADRTAGRRPLASGMSSIFDIDIDIVTENYIIYGICIYIYICV